MAKNVELPENIVSDIQRLGSGSFLSWLSENEITLPKTDNLFDSINAALDNGTLDIKLILAAISELEENSEKKIFLFHSKGYRNLTSDRKSILTRIKKSFGFSVSADATIRTQPGAGPTFSYLFINDEVLKLKFCETHYNREDDLINDKIIRIPVIVNIYLIVDLKNGFTQLRFDTAGQIHTHKNDLGKPSEVSYQEYYKDYMVKFLPEINFQPFNLSGVANHISLNEKERFLMRKEVTTISEGAKQTYSTARKKGDIRFLKEHVGAAATDKKKEWITEDISGYWLASHSDGELNKDLFMRIYRKDSEIRVQRGCLKKELDYGIKQIREIQKTI